MAIGIPARITGRVQVTANGNVLLNKAGASIEGAGLNGQPNFELTPLMGDGGIHGYTETPIFATCNVTITDRDDTLLHDLAVLREDATIIFQSAGSGKKYTMALATCTRNITVTAGEGETPIKFVGAFWTEETY